MKNLSISLIVGIFFFYLSSRGIKFSVVGNTLNNLNYIYLIPVCLIHLSIGLLRAYRLQILYNPLQKINFITALGVNSVGYLFIFILPMRLGEFIIPYLMKKNTNLSLSSAFAVIVVERLTDLFVLVSIFFMVLSNYLLPSWLLQSVASTAFVLFILLLCLSLLYIKSHIILPLMLKLLNFLPMTIHRKLEYISIEFSKGLKVIQGPWQIIHLILLSFFIWFVSSSVIFYLFMLMNLKMDIFQSIIVMVINTIGVALPAGPGMIGNFQYSCIIALEIFGVDKTISFAFANIYYLIGLGMTFLYGLLLLPTINFSLKEIKRDVLALLKSN